MKLIQDVLRLSLALPYVAVIMGFWLVLLSKKPSSTSKFVGQQIAKTVFQLFNFYSYITCIFSPFKFIFQPTPPDNYCSVPYEK